MAQVAPQWANFGIAEVIILLGQYGTMLAECYDRHDYQFDAPPRLVRL